VENLSRFGAATAKLEVDPVAGQNEGWVGRAAVVLVHGLGHEAGIASNLLDLLTSTFPLPTLVAHDTCPGVLVHGAVGEMDG
jgi:hypothetical protein